MDIIINRETPTFDSDVVKQSGFIVAKHFSWKSPRSGLVTFVTPQRMTCLFQRGSNAAVSYFVIKAKEVADGDWEITYKTNLEE